MGDTKYPDGWYQIRTVDDEILHVLFVEDGFVRRKPVDDISFYRQHHYRIVPTHLAAHDQWLYAVLVKPPYDDHKDLGYIGGLYLSQADADAKARELNVKYGRGHAVVVRTQLSSSYVSPDKPKYDTYEVMARIDGFHNKWQAGIVVEDAHITFYNTLQATDRAAYRIFVRATSMDEAIALAKGVFRDHIGD